MSLSTACSDMCCRSCIDPECDHVCHQRWLAELPAAKCGACPPVTATAIFAAAEAASAAGTSTSSALASWLDAEHRAHQVAS